MKVYMAFLLTLLMRKRWMASGGFVVATDAEPCPVFDLADPESDIGSVLLLQFAVGAQRHGANISSMHSAVADLAANATVAGRAEFELAKTGPGATAGSQAVGLPGSQAARPPPASGGSKIAAVHHGERQDVGLAFLTASLHRAFGTVATREQNWATSLMLIIVVCLLGSLALYCLVHLGDGHNRDKGAASPKVEENRGRTPRAAPEENRGRTPRAAPEASPAGTPVPVPRSTGRTDRMPQQMDDWSVSEVPGTRVASPGQQPVNLETPSSRSTLQNALADSRVKLPIILPHLVMPAASTRLAIPVQPLFPGASPSGGAVLTLDVLGLSGLPLLTASVTRHTRDSMIEISLHSVSALLVKVTPKLQLIAADNSVIGTLSRESRTVHALQDSAGDTLVLLAHREGRTPTMPEEVKMLSPSQQCEHASVFLKPAAPALPAEHYEVIVSPGVDCVLVVALHLALVVFALEK